MSNTLTDLERMKQLYDDLEIVYDLSEDGYEDGEYYDDAEASYAAIPKELRKDAKAHYYMLLSPYDSKNIIGTSDVSAQYYFDKNGKFLTLTLLYD